MLELKWPFEQGVECGAPGSVPLDEREPMLDCERDVGGSVSRDGTFHRTLRWNSQRMSARRRGENRKSHDSVLGVFLPASCACSRPRRVATQVPSFARIVGTWLTLQRPCLGVPPESVTRMKGEPNFVMTVENLTSFNEAIVRHPDHKGWLLYTGGMPSPSWRRWYARVLDALPGGWPFSCLPRIALLPLTRSIP